MAANLSSSTPTWSTFFRDTLLLNFNFSDCSPDGNKRLLEKVCNNLSFKRHNLLLVITLQYPNPTMIITQDADWISVLTDV